MSRTRHLSGFVLSKNNYRENDQIIYFYTKELGKIELLIRGARKINSKLAPIIAEPFCFLDLVVARGKNNFHLIGGEKKQRYLGILENKQTIFLLNSLLKQINQIVKSEPDKKIFSLLKKFLNKINQSSEEKFLVLSNAFLIKILAFLGYCPEIKKCLICGFLPTKKELYFSLNRGGIICLRHSLYKEREQKGEELIKINQNILTILQKLLYQDFKFLLQQDFRQRDLKVCELVIKKFFLWHLN